MNILDIIFIVILAIAILRCFFRGFIDEIMAALSIFLPLLVAIIMYKPVSQWFSLHKYFSEILAFAIAFGGLFILMFIVVKFLHSSIEAIIDNLELETADKILGAILGIGEGVIIIAIILIVLRYQTVFKIEALLENSFIARLLLPIIAHHIPFKA